MKRQISFVACLVVPAIFCVIAIEPVGAQTTPTKPLTIEQIFTPGAMGGRGPETMEWSTDGTKLSYVQRDEKGEQGELWYVDAATGEKKVLVTAAKLPRFPIPMLPAFSAAVPWVIVALAAALLCMNAETRDSLLGRGRALSAISLGVLLMVLAFTLVAFIA